MSYNPNALGMQKVKIEHADVYKRQVEDPQAKPIWARYYYLKYCEPYVCDRDGLPPVSYTHLDVYKRQK